MRVFYRCIPAYLASVVLMAGIIYAPTILADDALLKKINALDKQYQEISIEYYKTNPAGIGTFKSIDSLITQFEKLHQQQQFEAAVQLIYSNLVTLQNNALHPKLADLYQFLLEQNQSTLANKVLRIIQQSGDEINLMKSRLYRAAYYSSQHKWASVLKTLGSNFSALEKSEVDYAHLIKGTALQHLKQHRLATESYRKIPPTSPYASYAQLNTAIAYIRQGWLTDARKKIKAMLEQADTGSDPELKHRLYVILGYALLQKEFYRDARAAFRHVSLNSRYTSRALLGIALSATNQGDYIGGLHALSQLKQLKTNDLPYDEGFLVLPLLYQKLNQPASIASTYSEAIEHYKRRISVVEQLTSSNINPDQLQFDTNTGDITVDQLRLEYIQQYPATFFTNKASLIEKIKSSTSAKLNRKMQRLLQAYHTTSKEILNSVLKQRHKFLSSYLNQARYGLARHYDNQQRSNP